MKTKATTLVYTVLLGAFCCTLLAQVAQQPQPQYPIGIVGQEVSDQFLNFTLNGYFNAFVDSSYLPLFSVGRLYQGPRAPFQHGDVGGEVFTQQQQAQAANTPATPAPAASPEPTSSPTPAPVPAGGPAAGGEANAPVPVSPVTATAALLDNHDGRISSKDAIYGRNNPLLEAASIQATSRFLYQLQLDQIFQVSDISRGFDENILNDTIISVPTLGWRISNIQPAITPDPNVLKYQFNLGANTIAGAPTISYLVSLLANSPSYKLVPFNEVQPEWTTVGLAKQQSSVPQPNDPFDKNYRARIMNMQLGISDLPDNFWRPSARFLAVCYRARTFDLSNNLIESARIVPLSNNAFSIRKIGFNENEALSESPSTLYARNYRTIVPGQHQDNKGLWWQGQDWSNLIGGSYESGSEVSDEQQSRYTSPAHLIQGALYLNPLAELGGGAAGGNANANPFLSSKPIYSRISNRFGGLGCVLYERFASGSSLTHNMWYGLARSSGDNSNNMQSGSNSQFSLMPSYNDNTYFNGAGRTCFSPEIWMGMIIMVIATLL